MLLFLGIIKKKTRIDVEYSTFRINSMITTNANQAIAATR